MKIRKMTVIAAIAVAGIINASCGNKQQQANSEGATTEVVASGAMEIDSLLANAGELAGQEVTIEGVCTHICKHGGRKIFLMGSDDTQTIRVEGGSVGKFDQKCVNSIVRVTGDLKEQRIDEAVILELHLSGLGITIFKAELREIVGLLRRNIGKDGNNALCAERHHRNDLVVVARPDIEVVAALRHGFSQQREVAGSSLEAVDIRVLRQLIQGIGGEGNAGTARHVVKNNRKLYRLCDL